MPRLPTKHRALLALGPSGSYPLPGSVSTFQSMSASIYHGAAGPAQLPSSFQSTPVSTADAGSGNSPTPTDSPTPTSDGTTLMQASAGQVESNKTPQPSTTEHSSSTSLAPSTSGGSSAASSGGGGNYKVGSDGQTTPVVVGTSPASLGAPAALSSDVVSSSLLPDSGSNAGNTPVPSSTTHTASAASSRNQMSAGAIAGITCVCLISLLALIVLIVQRRSIARRLELRRRWWFSRTPLSGSFFIVNRPHSPPGSDCGQSSRSSFATHFDQGLAFRVDPPSTFSQGIIPDLPPMAEVRERNSVWMSSGSTLAHRDSVYSLRSNGSDPDAPYLAVSMGQHNDNDGPPSPMSVRPFSPSESFSFPKPPMLLQSDSPYAPGTRGSASSQSSVTTLVQVSTPPRAFMTDLPPASAPTPSPYPLQAPMTGTISPVIAAAHTSLDPFADPVEPEFADVEVIRRSFAPSMNDELAVYRGDRVRIIQSFDDGWAIAERLANSGSGYGMRQENKQGLIPVDCLREQGQPLPTFLAQKRMNSYGSGKELMAAVVLFGVDVHGAEDIIRYLFHFHHLLFFSIGLTHSALPSDYFFQCSTHVQYRSPFFPSSHSVLGSLRQSTANAQSAYAAPYDNGLFTPVEHLSALSVDSFTTLGHPYFPNYSVRIKKSDFCDGTVNAYTGYIDIEARHIFFYFFESRNDPATDDVIFWTNGGPGCSSSLGLFMELGPCRALSGNGTTYHPESWNANANIFFVDQPVGVGFSYADYGETVSTTEEAARDIAAFVAIFFENFNQFKGRTFHMAGESYGGRYIPVFAAEVYDQNAKLVAAGLTPVNLQSVMIGNGIVDYFTLTPSYIDMQCTSASVFPVSSISSCVRMKQALPRCQKWTLESCIDRYDAPSCGVARDFCENELSEPFFATGMNPYDISKKCEGGPGDLCYPVMKNIRKYLDLPSTRTLLGVDPSVPLNFSSCSDSVGNAFTRAQDEYHSTYTHVSLLLERGVRALIYVGTYDWICNWIGNERWTLKMPWTGQEAFVSQPLREWKVDGQVAGKTRSARGLTFATIDRAGHMVPYDKPKEALTLVQRWLAGQEL